jgi:electron transfer flavoprotein beta subunit
MKIGVCIKRVPATDTRIQIMGPSEGPDLSNVTWKMNPYDEFAVEQALQYREAGIASDVVLLTVGGTEVEGQVREGLAMGKRGQDASKAVRIDDPAIAGSDTLGIARILAAAVQKEGIGLVLCGKQAVDGDSAQVPSMLAELLGWPQALAVTKMEIEGERVRAWRPVGGGRMEIVELPLPAVISCDKGLNKPRYPTLPGIMMAKRKPIEALDLSAIGLDGSSVGTAAARVQESRWDLPPARPTGRILEGEGPVVVKELIRLLREEAKVI